MNTLSSPETRRVVITGIGVVSSQGIGINDFWENLISGKSQVDVISLLGIDKDKYTPYASKIRNFSFEKYMVEANMYNSYMDRGLEFGMVAAKEAYTDSKIATFRNEIDNDRFGIYVASTCGGLSTVCNKAKNYILAKGKNAFDFKTFYAFMPGLWGAVLAHYFRVNGPVSTYSISCCSGGESIGQCYRDIKYGTIDIGICGGCDAPIVPINYLSFRLIKATSRWKGNPKGACRPFSKDRCGMVFGEGGAFLVLENLELAKQRNAKIYGEITGYGATSDGHHMVAPSDGAEEWARAIQIAVNESQIPVDSIDYVSCHGTGTKLNDSVETLAIKKALGEHSYKIAIGSIKSMIGHAFGGATAIEVVSLVKILQTQIAPPTINYAEQDSVCDLDCVPNVARKIKCDYLLKTATGFGGSNIALIVKRFF